MNNFDLDKTLRSAPAPRWSEDYWREFPADVTRRLRTAPPARGSHGQWRPRFAWGFGIAAACLAIGFAIGHWHGRNQADSFALLRDQKMLREVLTMFPDRVRAIEQDGRGMHLVLSDKADVPESTPLWIEICDGKNCRAVVTFSGQEIEIAREKVEVLADAQGKVMLVGNNFVWSSANPDRTADGLRIRAHSVAVVM